MFLDSVFSPNDEVFLLISRTVTRIAKYYRKTLVCLRLFPTDEHARSAVVDARENYLTQYLVLSR